MTISDLPIGAKLVFGRFSRNGTTPETLGWLKVHRDNTLLTEWSIGAFAFDAKEPTNPNKRIRDRGNNQYSVSNIRQFLNSFGPNWFSPQHEDDAPPAYDNIACGYGGYSEAHGFLSAFEEWELESILPTTIVCGTRDYNHPKCYFDWFHSLTDKVCIPSASNLTSEAIENGWEHEGDLWDLFHNPEVDAYDVGEGFVMTRTMSDSGSGVIISLDVDGRICRNYAANGGVHVRPYVILRPDTVVSDEPNDEGYYEVLEVPQEVVEINEADLFTILFN